MLELYDEKGGLLRGAARLVDLSSVGARFASTLALPKGQHVRGRLRLMHIGALDIAGRIVRIKEGSNATLYGIEFDAVRRAPRIGSAATSLQK